MKNNFGEIEQNLLCAGREGGNIPKRKKDTLGTLNLGLTKQREVGKNVVFGKNVVLQNVGGEEFRCRESFKTEAPEPSSSPSRETTLTNQGSQ